MKQVWLRLYYFMYGLARWTNDLGLREKSKRTRSLGKSRFWRV